MMPLRLTSFNEKSEAGTAISVHEEALPEDKENEVLLQQREEDDACPVPAKRQHIASIDNANNHDKSAVSGVQFHNVILPNDSAETVHSSDTFDESEELLLLEHEDEVDTIEEVLNELKEEERRKFGMSPLFIFRNLGTHSDPLNVFAGDEADDIFCYLVKAETRSLKKDLFALQDEVTADARFILISWMWSITHKFQQEVFFTAVHLVDSYLLHSRATKSTLQLIGATAVLISTKYHVVLESSTLQVLSGLCGGACDKDDIVCMELEMLFVVNFRIISVMPCDFLERWLVMADATPKQRLYARFLCKASTLDVRMLQYRPSSIAAAAILVAQTLFSSKGQQLLLPMIYHEADFKAILSVAVELSEFVRQKQRRFVLKEKYLLHDRQIVETNPPTKEILEQAVKSLFAMCDNRDGDNDGNLHIIGTTTKN